jgi:hypothetical protein
MYSTHTQLNEYPFLALSQICNSLKVGRFLASFKLPNFFPEGTSFLHHIIRSSLPSLGLILVDPRVGSKCAHH